MGAVDTLKSKAIADLQVNDVFQTYHGGSMKPCRVLSEPRSSDGLVMFKIGPVSNTQCRNCDVTVVKFAPTAVVQVMGRHKTDWSRIEAEAKLLETYCGCVRQLLTPEMGLCSVRQVSDIIMKQSGYHSPTFVRRACRHLADEGELKVRTIGRMLLYRRTPMPMSINQPVIEFLGTKSQAFGTIVDFAPYAGTDLIYPIVRRATGTLAFSSDDILDCASAARWLPDY